MEIWRLTRNNHLLPDGEGARLYGGRWNFPKTAIVYTSSTLSLAVLEYLVHLDTDLIPNNVVSLGAHIPPTVSVTTIALASLPLDWREMHADPPLQHIGSNWALSNSTAVLQVPSAIIPSEFNLLLNPNHPDFQLITWSTPLPFTLDPRLINKHS